MIHSHNSHSSRKKALLLFLSVSFCWPSAAESQWPSEVSPGARVRVRLPEREHQAGDRRGLLLRGRVTTLNADTLYLAITDSIGPVAIPRGLIDEMGVSRGVPSRGHSALRRGLISGALWSLLFAGMALPDDETDVGTAALVGAGIGVTLGGIIGALRPQERWKSLRMIPRDNVNER